MFAAFVVVYSTDRIFLFRPSVVRLGCCPSSPARSVGGLIPQSIGARSRCGCDLFSRTFGALLTFQSVPLVEDFIYLFYYRVLDVTRQADSVRSSEPPIMDDEEASTSAAADSETQPQESAAVSAANSRALCFVPWLGCGPFINLLDFE